MVMMQSADDLRVTLSHGLLHALGGIIHGRPRGWIEKSFASLAAINVALLLCQCII